MKCPACGHVNLTDFPFCEQCLTLLQVGPSGPLAGGFDLQGLGHGDRSHESAWPPFPWNPRELEDPLIGREKARKMLLAGFRSTVDTWTSRIHLLVSEYGMGKSRLAKGLTAQAREAYPDTWVISTRCPETGGPFRMWDAVLREAFEIPNNADPEMARERFKLALTELVGENVDELLQPICKLMGWQTGPKGATSEVDSEDALIGRGSAALTRLMAMMSVRRPLLIVMRNANRATTRSLALAGAIEATLKDRPFMMLLAGSNALTGILPGWELYPTTRLEPLVRADAERMLKLFLSGIEDVPKDLVKRLLEQGKGNPYALKTLVRYLRQSGAIRLNRKRWQIDEDVTWDLDMPETLEGVVLAQFGSMSPEERQVMAHAAVIGHEFWLGALVALHRQGAPDVSEPGSVSKDGASIAIQASLDRLIERRFIEPAESSLPGQEAFVFRSDMHWSVTSEVLPEATKTKLHRVVLQWLKLHVGDTDGDHLKELARHASAADFPVQAAGYLMRLAVVLRSQYHWRQEREVLDRAFSLVGPEDNALKLEVALALGDSCVELGDMDAALESFQHALNIAWRMRHHRSGARALQRIGVLERERGSHRVGYDHLLQALRLFESVNDTLGAAETCIELGRLMWFEAKFEQALNAYRRAEKLYRAMRNRAGLGLAVHCIGGVHFDRGDLDLALEYLDDALELRRRINDRRGIARTLTNVGVIRHSLSDFDRALEAWEEANLIAIELGDLDAQATLANNIGEILVDLGKTDKAQHYLERAVAMASDGDMALLHVDAMRNMGVLFASLGDWDAAHKTLQRAKEAADRLGLLRAIAMVARSLGDLGNMRHEAGDEQALKVSEGHYRRATHAFTKGGYDVEAAVSEEHLALLLERQGRTVEAKEALARAAELKRPHRMSGEIA